MSETPSPNIVILGGGIAGLTVAKSLADNKIAGIVVEKSGRLGGRVRDWACMASERCLRCFACSVEDLVEEVENSSLVTVRTGYELSSVVASEAGIDRVELRSADGEAIEAIDTSALVIATGFEPYDPSEKVFWGYGQLDGVYTIKDMDALLRNDDLTAFEGDASKPLNVAFFQCVGSRDASIGANYCSQYCCKGALRLALRLLKERPDWKITLFYIDLQIAGKFAGSLLKEAADKGVRLIQGVPGEVVQGPEGQLQVIREDEGRNVRELYDRIILSIGQRPPVGIRETASLLGLPVNELGFLGAGAFPDSGRTAVRGVYVAGTCCGPKDIEATVEHAGQTASAIITDLGGSARV
jgi:heterodisulfide reductase subunit A2